MRKYTLKHLFTALLLLCSITANAHDFEVDGIFYNITSTDNKTVAVTYSGSSYSAVSNEYSGAVTIPATVTYNGTSYSVTTIGNYAFRGCTELIIITIPESITTIGSYAFDKCTGLAAVRITNLSAWCKIYFSDSNPLYYAKNLYLNGEKVTNLVIPNDITRIKQYAFYGCTGLTSVTIPNSVTTIGENAFRGCSGLTSVTIPNSVTAIGESAFNRCTELTSVTIPNSVTTIGRSAFYDCTGLASVTIPNSVTSIGNNAFNSCSGLTAVHISDLSAWCKIDFAGSISNPLYYAKKLYLNGEEVTNLVIPNDITRIKQYAFFGCTGLTSVTIPNSVTTIGNDAFGYCSGLTSVEIGNSVTSIGNYAFYDCTGLTAVHISDLSAWCNIDFSGYDSNPLYYAHNLYINGEIVTNLVIPDDIIIIKKASFYGFTSLTSVTINNNVMAISDNAFTSCTGLTSITIPDNVLTIGSAVFEGCTGLISATIGNSVTRIGESTFEGCTNLTNVTIGNSVTYIESSAFEGCTGLISATIGNSVTTIGSGAFKGCTGLTAVHISDLPAWCNIDFSYYNSNPLYYAKNLYLNGEKVTDLVIPNDITRIKQYTFYGCTGLTSVTIPNSVTTIGSSAFDGCTGLTSVTIPNNVTTIGSSAFYDCTGLTSVTIPNSVTTIGENAFKGCTGLTSVTIPNSVTTIGSSAFYGCDYLKIVYNNSSLDITVGSSNHGYVAYYAMAVITPNDYIPEDGFIFHTNDGTHTLIAYIGNDSILSLPKDYNGENYAIGDKAFSGCINLTSVTISNSVTSIGESAFEGCSCLTSVTIPNSVTTIGSGAFDDCTGLTAVHISDLSAWCNIDFSYYNSNPLYYAHNLYINGEEATNLVIPDDVTEIKYCAFYDCHNIKNVIIPENVTQIGSYTFRNCSNLVNITISNNVAGIGFSAFDNCASLKNLHIKEGKNRLSLDCNNARPTSIGEGLFYDCPLENIYLGRNITYHTLYSASVGYSPFYNKKSIKTITIGKEVTNILKYAFYGSDNLTAIYAKTSIPPSIEETTFTNYSATLYVPIGAKAAYKAADYWKNFGNIVEMEFTVAGDVDGDDTVDVADVTAIVEVILAGTEDVSKQQTFDDWTSTNTGTHSSTSQGSYTLEATEGGVLTFDWSVSSENNYDWLIITIDGTQILKKSGSNSGSYTHTFSTAGTHTLVVKYTKDGSASSGSDKGSIYNIILSDDASNKANRADIDNDGTLDVADITALVDIILRGE